MRIPRIVLALLLLTAAYFVAAAVWHEDPENRPLENPYRMLVRLERDGVLRSAHQGEQVVALRHQRSWSFERERHVEAQLRCAGGVRGRFVDAGLVEGSGSLELERPDEARGLVLELPFELPDGPSIVVEGRLRARPGAGLRLALSPAGGPGSEPADAARDTVAADPESPILVTPWMPDGEAPGGDLADAPARDDAEGWLDFRLGLCRPLPLGPVPEPTSLRLWIETEAPRVQIDELRLRPGTRIDGLLARGHARGFGATESTRELKRVVARGPDERLCLLMPSPTTLTFALTLPRSASLDFAVSALAETASFGTSQLDIALRRAGEFEISLARVPVGTHDVSRFTPQRIELGAYSGEEVELQFRVLAPGDPRPPVVLLADPVIRAASLEEAPPHVFLISHAPVEQLRLAEGEVDPFALLATRGLPLTPRAPGGAPGSSELLALLTSRNTPPRPANTVPDPALRIPSLAAVLADRGYRTFAATHESREGWLLSGFARRWNADQASAVDGAIRWLDQQQGSPCFAWIQLPRRGGRRALRQWIDALRGRELFDNSVIVVWPEDDPSGTALLCAPGLDGEARPLPEPFPTIDLAPTLLELLDLPRAGSFAGRRWTLEALRGEDTPSAPAAEGRRPREDWSYVGAGLPAFTAQVFDASGGRPR